MACNCVNIVLNLDLYLIQYSTEAGGSGGVAVFQRGNYNNFRWYLFNIGGFDFVIWYDNVLDRYVVQNGNTPNNGGTIHLQWLNFVDIPSGSINTNEWDNVSGVFGVFNTSFVAQPYNIEANIFGTFNNENYYQFEIEGQNHFLYYGVNQWEFAPILGGSGEWGAWKNSTPPCPPFGSSPVWITGSGVNSIETKECETFLTDCLTIYYTPLGDYSGDVIQLDVNIYAIGPNGAPIFIFQVPEYPDVYFQIYYSETGISPYWPGWYLVTMGPQGDFVSFLESDGSFVNFPQGGPNVYGWLQMNYFNIFETQVAKECPIDLTDCSCGLKFTINFGGETLITEPTLIGIYNDRNYYELTFDGQQCFIYWNGYQWDFSPVLGGGDNVVIARLFKNSFCPIGDPAPIEPINFLNYWIAIGDLYQDFLTIKSEGVECKDCGREDRIFRKYDAIQLPPNFSEPNRGLKDCCCENLVLASSSSNTWENDLTSAWIKLNIGGTAQFKLLKEGIETNFTPTPQLFVKEPNAIYTTINWNDVLVSDGPGCYELVIEYNISGIVGNLSWGNYKLLPFSIEAARKTARVRAIFNGYHEIEQINFTGSNVESSHRFYGFIGNRQPNTEIDNLIYGDRQMKRVIRENLNQYEILTDPVNECELLPLIDLYLLSENELFISDYNAHNFTYRINDLPVIVEESAEIEYKEFSRKASLKCIVGDKFKNKRTYFDK